LATSASAMTKTSPSITIITIMGLVESNWPHLQRLLRRPCGRLAAMRPRYCSASRSLVVEQDRKGVQTRRYWTRHENVALGIRRSRRTALY
jgi:hypothetical protein